MKGSAEADKLSLTDLVVIALIDEEPRHGFAVARELKPAASIGQVWMVPAPLVYRAVDRLADCALIERAGTEPGAKGPIRTVYRTTDSGHARLLRWLDEPIAHPREFRTEFLAKVVLLARRGRSPAELARRQIEYFAPVAAGLAGKVVLASGPDHAVALWRSESMCTITRFLEAMAAGDGGDGRALREPASAPARPPGRAES